MLFIRPIEYHFLLILGDIILDIFIKKPIYPMVFELEAAHLYQYRERKFGSDIYRPNKSTCRRGYSVNESKVSQKVRHQQNVYDPVVSFING